ncbi:uncharacterized protein LOC134669916 [Cydia fagiglandana]|uniref:uncharacterized protein LOC134669916 n=1 Tax=Cydia fagiglandana TaxID=1458189 RepID=UPI002FEDFDD0
MKRFDLKMTARLKKYFTYNYDKNIVELFKPLYVLLSITGLFPYAIELPKGRHDTIIIRKSLISHSLGALLFIAFLSFYFTQKIQILMNTAAMSSVTNITNIMEITVALLCAIVIYFSAFRNANTYVHILKDIASCWADLCHVNVTPILVFLRRLLTYPALVWLVIFSYVQITLFVIGTQKVYKQLIFFTVPDAIPSLIVAFYSAMVLLIICLLKNIEEHCQIIVNAKRVRTAFAIDCSVTNVRTVTSGGSTKDWVCLENLEQVYVKVLEIKQDINNAFQAPISLIIIQCFHGILSDAHTLYSEIVVNMRFDAHLLVEQVFLVLYSLAKMYALTFTGTLLKDEASLN